MGLLVAALATLPGGLAQAKDEPGFGREARQVRGGPGGIGGAQGGEAGRAPDGPPDPKDEPGFGGEARQVHLAETAEAAHEALLERVMQAGAGSDAKEALLAIVEEAAAAGLPLDPILTKFLEGVSKGVAEARILAAVRAVQARLSRAAAVLQEAVQLGAAGPVTGADVARVAGGLAAGVPPEQVMTFALAAAEAGAPISRVTTAVAALEHLRGLGVYEEEAAAALASAISDGMRDEDLRRMAEDYRRFVMAGGDPEAFFHPRPEDWEGGGISGAGIQHDAAGRLDAGRLPDESGGGERVVPGTDRLSRDGDEDEDPYDRERPDPRDDLIPDRPDEDDEPPDTPKPEQPPSDS